MHRKKHDSQLICYVNSEDYTQQSHDQAALVRNLQFDTLDTNFGKTTMSTGETECSYFLPSPAVSSCPSCRSPGRSWSPQMFSYYMVNIDSTKHAEIPL